MHKIPECDRCKFNAHSNYVVCAVHPNGADSDRCPDFLLDSTSQEAWAPTGFTFIDEQLRRNPVAYWVDVDFEPTRTRSQQWVILETHPFFTGVCPSCGAAYPTNVKLIHYDCGYCGWIDG